MSTDHQRYSIDNQTSAIAEYATCHNIAVVRTYSDEGRSGVTMKGRDALKRLIADVQCGHADFDVILVYDVSRWGRFQDADESAYYEFICKSAGIAVIYCAELFENNGSLLATLLKVLKRAMAGEYSRELSEKIARAHRQQAKLGFHQGGPANFGLRRLLIDANNRAKTQLKHGEAKSIQTDRVILAKGPIEETNIVREIFRLYAEESMPHRQIARHLNKKGIRNRRGNAWSNTNIINMLRNEKYAGTFVYCRTTWNLMGGWTRNSYEKWVRVENVIEPIVDRKTFEKTQSKLKDGWTYTDNELLNFLTAAWCINGYLSAPKMNASKFTPTPVTYRQRFGSLSNAYRLIGYRPVHAYRYSKSGELIRKLHREIICRLTSTADKHASQIVFNVDKQVLEIDRTVSVAIVVLPYLPRNNTVSPGWKLYFDRLEECDVVFVSRMNKDNSRLLDHYLLPRSAFSRPSYRFTEKSIRQFRKFRLANLNKFCEIALSWASEAQTKLQ